jgi:pimeloyl-ACP methyl ester carboxylesterase
VQRRSNNPTTAVTLAAGERAGLEERACQHGYVLFALVHGTTQSTEGWGPLSEQLCQAGHDVFPVDLAGMPTDSSTAAYALAAAAQLPTGEADVVVAHSGSGLLLPGIALAVRARLQIFLAAFIPNGRTSLVGEVEDDAASIFHSNWIGVDPTADHEAARHFLFHDCTVEVSNWALGTLRRFQPLAAFTEVVRLAADVPAVAIVPDGDRTLRSEWMKRAAADRLGIDSIIIPGGHCPHVSRPSQVAEILGSLL